MTHEQHANTNNGYKHCSCHKKPTVLQSAQTKLWKNNYWWEAISLK